ncbi:WEB family protein [Abeliophyllum distichum]|uniref:WEB family protein n=1 Tax=Abeliophyllum distichum TaxID=126358 RepID=A0ABD1SUY2_9LAMI
MEGAEIDTSAPFQSVKEAVVLFGDRVLAGELYANKIKQMRDKASEYGHVPSRLGTVTAELEETKQSLQKAREERMQMASCLSTLQEELGRTKRELQQLMKHESDKCLLDLKIEELKFDEDSTKFQVKKETTDEKVEFQKKKYVRFAKPSSVAQISVPESSHDAVLQRHHSLKKKKKKQLIHLLEGYFSRIKRNSEVASLCKTYTQELVEIWSLF